MEKYKLLKLSQVQLKLHIILVLIFVMSFIDVTRYQVVLIKETQMIMLYFHTNGLEIQDGHFKCASYVV